MSKRFSDAVWSYYRTHGRSLPWRNLPKNKQGYMSPYKILVSEVMLQQTQAERVIPKYKTFLKTFPTVQVLAKAPLSQVLKVWQGLGYNRRAKMLHACAKAIVQEYSGVFPKSYKELQALPGVGPYTAGAVMAFAYNEPVPVIETNIRTVYLHHFFKDRDNVTDTEIMRLIVRDLEQGSIRKNPREWYAALMDYGTHLKKTIGNQNSRSRHYTKQSKFAGSNRQIRGAILRELASTAATTRQLYARLPHESFRIKIALEVLKDEGFIAFSRKKWHLKE